MLWPKTTLTLLADQREIADGLLKYLSNFLNFAFFSPGRVKSHFSTPHSKTVSRDSYSIWAVATEQGKVSAHTLPLHINTVSRTS